MITDGDLRRMLEKNVDLATLTARDIMTSNPKKIDKDEFAVEALHVMQEKSITQLVVISDGKVAGFIHLHDLLKEGIV
jgi:arabinose-5-phosphate isomerase